MLLPAALTPEAFLADYWQKEPLFIPHSLGANLPTLDRDELAWLATLPDVESRIVFTEQRNSSCTYRMEQGPFDALYLKNLCQENWTLLVQDVDKHLPDFKSWFNEVPFIPGWRIDDLMVSFAAPGGSVGPHKDNYDVFLCQGDGTRDWQVTTKPTTRRDELENELDLLLPFEPSASHQCKTGDVLYLPPQSAHWGVAVDRCTTYSIGLRAPTMAELAAAAAHAYPRNVSTTPTIENTCGDIFYSDLDLRLEEAHGCRISTRSIERLREQALIHPSLNDEQAATILCSLVTDPKSWLKPETPSFSDVKRALAGEQALVVHGMTRLAWYTAAMFNLASVNGVARAMAPRSVEFFQLICDSGCAEPSQIQELIDYSGGRQFLHWLLTRATFDLAAE